MLVETNDRELPEKLLQEEQVLGVLEDGLVTFSTNESLPLIEQPVVQNFGHTGAGTAIAVIDTGVRYRDAFFGSTSACQAGNFQPACKVAAAKNCLQPDCTANETTHSYSSHGTNVAATALSVAPNAKIISLQVFSGTANSSENQSRWSYVADAVNWILDNRDAYNIVAANMSFNTCRYDASGGCNTCVRYGSDCTWYNSLWDEDTTAYILTHSLWSAGVIPVASAGNSGYVDGLTSPACSPWAISVGAVADSSQTFGAPFARQCRSFNEECSDYGYTGFIWDDYVVCYSSSATHLEMLAPGHRITAAGYEWRGTSQAAPHVAGAVAVLSAAFPAWTVVQIRDRLLNTGDEVADQRTGQSFPRLNLCKAIFGKTSWRCN